MAGRIAALIVLIFALVSAPLAAQDDVQSTDRIAQTPEQMVAKAKQSYGPPKAKPRCDPNSEDPDVIVVCGELEEQSQFRIRTDEEVENDYARATMNKGAPQVPADLINGPGIFTGPATVSGICGIGLGGCPPPPALIIDLDEIPEAPKGSDADLIGKGEKAP
jgi:hypothetical protein